MQYSLATVLMSRRAATPVGDERLDVERRHACQRTFGHARIDLRDGGVQRGQPSPDLRFARKCPDRGELGLDLAQQLEGGRQHADPLATDELLHPPVRIVRLVEVGQWLAGSGQVLERALGLGLADELLEPRLPALARRLPLRHGAFRPPWRAEPSVSMGRGNSYGGTKFKP